MRVHLGGHLSWYDPGKRAWLELDARTVLEASTSQDRQFGRLTPAGLAQYLGLPRGEIALIAVNGRVVDPNADQLAQDDRVEFYPPIGGG
jgi:sulfur carrier protein ThiS